MLAVLADEGDECGGGGADGRGEAREPVERLLRLQIRQGEPAERVEALRLLKNVEIYHFVCLARYGIAFLRGSSAGLT